MNASNDPDWDAIGRFFAGESSAEEAAAVQAWLHANPRDREILDRVNGAAAAEPTAFDVEAALASVHRRMAERAPALTVDRGSKPAIRRRPPTIVIGAIVAAAVAAAVAFLMISNRSSGPTSRPVTVTAQTYTTAVGQRRSLTLPDSSRVILGPGSKLVVLADYSTGARRISLEGDAYFDVRHDAAQPFSVRVASAVIEDIGTRFTIESDEGDSTTVSVMEGSVRLRASSAASDAGVVLAAGDRGAIDPAGDARVEHHVVSASDIAWTTGNLTFRDATLARVSAELHRWYGVTLKVEDSTLLSRHVNASFTGEPVDRVLQILGLTLDATIERRGDTATVSATRGR